MSKHIRLACVIIGIILFVVGVSLSPVNAVLMIIGIILATIGGVFIVIFDL